MTAITDESDSPAPSTEAMLVECKAQVARLESVIAVLRQQAANHQRNELESLEHVRTACRQRDEARERAEKAEAQVARWSVLANDYQDALVEANAALERLKGPRVVQNAVMEPLHHCSSCDDGFDFESDE